MTSACRRDAASATTAIQHMTDRAVFLIGPLAVMVLAFLYGVNNATAQTAFPRPPVPGATMHGATSVAARFVFDEASHILVGMVAALAGVLAHRAWSRRRWRRAPAGVVVEAVLAVDLVNSTWLATHHGEELAMRARNLLERRALAAASPQGVTFVENTGDGCMMTFPSAIAAARAADTLLRGLRDRPPQMAPAPLIEVRAAITYGQILLDSRGSRHAAAINEAFRLMSVAAGDFVAVEGEQRLEKIPDRNRVFLDEDAANEVKSSDIALRQAGICRLKGFGGFHRVYELRWSDE